MTGQDTNLDDIRREIDAIDDGIVDLLARRAAAQARVKLRKVADGSLAISPLRPAREAEILRRITARGKGAVAADLLVRLWRVILSASTLSQADVRTHVTRRLQQSSDMAPMLTAHFGPMPVDCHDTTEEALRAIATRKGDLCVVETSGDWAAVFATAGGARVIGVLPVLKHSTPPLLIVGHVPSQPTGRDCTLIIVNEGSEAPEGRQLWAARSGAQEIICLAGFIDSVPGSSGTIIAGQFPDQIES